MISLIIPVLNAEKYIEKLLEKIFSQTVVPDEIIILDSESEDRTIDICKKYDRVRVIDIKRKDFDHGGTRHIGFQNAKGEYCFMMSQDALPADDKCFEKMLSAFENDGIVMATARQIPYEDASLIEKLTREFNYPDRNIFKDKSMQETLGVKTFFFSDVCSVYKKDVYFELGGYDVPTLICTDMIMAAKAINAGYKTAYMGCAEVYHSHNYTLTQQYKRNFDVAADMKINHKYFENVSDTSEGVKMVFYVLKKLISKLHFITAVYYCFECAAKLFGNRAGKRYESLSKEKILKKTTNKAYWLKKYS